MNDIELLKEKISGKTYVQIAGEQGVSRQRIQQILSPIQAIRLFFFKKHNHRCVQCDTYVGTHGHIHHKELIENYQDIDNLELLCKSCHSRIHAHHSIDTLICSYCGKKFQGNASKIKARKRRNTSGKFFCSKFCQGKFIGKTYGWQSEYQKQK